MSASDRELVERRGVTPPYEPDESHPPGATVPRKRAFVVHEVARTCRLAAMSRGLPDAVPRKRNPTKTIDKPVTTVRYHGSGVWRSVPALPVTVGA